MRVLPYRIVRAGAIITGREIYEGRKEDAFAPLLRQRLKEYGCALAHTEIVPDEERIPSHRHRFGFGLDMIFVTGGGSPDDSTSKSIAASADEVVFHGVPVAPGAMTVLAYAARCPSSASPEGCWPHPEGSSISCFLDFSRGRR
jgi:molybdopterin biosynthesis enzyme